MTLKMLLVDEEQLALLQKQTIEKELGYHVDCTEEANQARKLIENNDYQVLMIDPLKLGIVLSPNALRTKLIKEARRRNILVIISSYQSQKDLLSCCGLIYGRDYQVFFEKPYYFEEIRSALRKIV